VYGAIIEHVKLGLYLTVNTLRAYYKGKPIGISEMCLSEIIVIIHMQSVGRVHSSVMLKKVVYVVIDML
jgi:hypothetical protein